MTDPQTDDLSPDPASGPGTRRWARVAVGVLAVAGLATAAVWFAQRDDRDAVAVGTSGTKPSTSHAADTRHAGTRDDPLATIDVASGDGVNVHASLLRTVLPESLPATVACSEPTTILAEMSDADTDTSLSKQLAVPTGTEIAVTRIGIGDADPGVPGTPDFSSKVSTKAAAASTPPNPTSLPYPVLFVFRGDRVRSVTLERADGTRDTVPADRTTHLAAVAFRAPFANPGPTDPPNEITLPRSITVTTTDGADIVIHTLSGSGGMEPSTFAGLLAADGTATPSPAMQRRSAGECGEPSIAPAGTIPPPNDGSVEQITTRAGEFLDVNRPIADRAALTTDATRVTAIIEHAALLNPMPDSALTQKITRIEFVDHDTAYVQAQVQLAGIPAAENVVVRVVRTDGQWKFTWESLCAQVNIRDPATCENTPSTVVSQADRMVPLPGS